MATLDLGKVVGESATIEVGNVTTLPAGSNATVENVGTSLEAVFNFGIPKGADGATESDYGNLRNKPQINSVELNGNKTLNELGIQPAGDYALQSDIPTELADLSENSTHRVVTDTEKATWNNKSDFSGDYNDLTNKPTIPDVSNFITKDVNDLTYYYTKTEVDGKVAAVYKYQGSVLTYNDLPSTGLTIGDVYNVETDDSNYAWTGSVWDKLGGTIDLSNYQTLITSTNKLNADLVDDTSSTNKFVTTSEKTTWNEKVGTTDYASSSAGGVIKVGSAYGTVVTGSGILQSSVRTNEQYQSDGNYLFISKGTLENVLANKGYEEKTNKATSISSLSTNNEYPSSLAVYNYVNAVVGNISSVLETLVTVGGGN